MCCFKSIILLKTLYVNLNESRKVLYWHTIFSSKNWEGKEWPSIWCSLAPMSSSQIFHLKNTIPPQIPRWSLGERSMVVASYCQPRRTLSVCISSCYHRKNGWENSTNRAALSFLFLNCASTYSIMQSKSFTQIKDEAPMDSARLTSKKNMLFMQDLLFWNWFLFQMVIPT